MIIHKIPLESFKPRGNISVGIDSGELNVTAIAGVC